MSTDLFGYEGKRIIVTGGGGAGMGASVVRILAELGAEIHVIDFKKPPVPVASHQAIDLKDPLAISAGIEKIEGPVHGLFNCAGVPGNRTSDMDTLLINFLGVKHLTEQVVPKLAENGAIATISSNAGVGWAEKKNLFVELSQIEGWDASVAWMEAHPEIIPEGNPAAAYSASKEAVSAWTEVSAVRVGELGKGIRQNAIQPGFTETPLASDFSAIVGGREFYDKMPNPLGRTLRPEDQAKALIFLNSGLASGITGVNMLVDGGGLAALSTGLGAMPAFS